MHFAIPPRQRPTATCFFSLHRCHRHPQPAFLESGRPRRRLGHPAPRDLAARPSWRITFALSQSIGSSDSKAPRNDILHAVNITHASEHAAWRRGLAGRAAVQGHGCCAHSLTRTGDTEKCVPCLPTLKSHFRFWTKRKGSVCFTTTCRLAFFFLKTLFLCCKLCPKVTGSTTL